MHHMHLCVYVLISVSLLLVMSYCSFYLILNYMLIYFYIFSSPFNFSWI